MKRVSFIIVLAYRMLLAAEPSPSELFERARMLEEKNQNLPEAIRLYAMVVTQSKAQRTLAARAQYQQGVLLERLGRKAEAQRAYRAVLRDFADQPAVVRVARAKIPGGGPATGITVRQVWAGKENVYFGSPSPDGRYLSFGDWETSDLAIRELATGEKRRLAGKNKQQAESGAHAASSLFSPDGSQVAYGWVEEGYEIRVISVDGSRLRTIYKAAGDDFTMLHDWSLDGVSILASTTSREATQLLLLSPLEGKVQLSRKIDWTGRPMKFSPDGRFIIYEAGGESGSDLRLLSVDGSRD